jgi:DNA ligase-1
MMNIVHQLRLAKGTNRKLEILERNQGAFEGQWQRVLLAMYDTSINYYVSAPKDHTFVSDEDLDVPSMLFLLGELASRTYTGNAARSAATEGSEDYGEIFRLVLDGSLKAGVSTKTINKAYPGLIPVFPVMLAKDVHIADWPVMASTKYDGVRVLAFVNPDKVVLKTRQGKEVRIDSLTGAMMRLPTGVYDGELVDGDGKMVGRSTISGAVTKCIRGTKNDISGYTFCIFDYVLTQEWHLTKTHRPYITRYAEVCRHVGDARLSNVIVAEQNLLYNQTQVDSEYGMLLARGYEGMILRYGQDPYIWDRTPKLIKKKAIKECTLRCIGVKMGTGKYEGLIGSLHCEGTVEGHEVKVSTGSGLSDADRENSEDYFVNKIIEAKYNDVVRAKGAEYYSLFLPRFKRIKGELDT